MALVFSIPRLFIGGSRRIVQIYFVTCLPVLIYRARVACLSICSRAFVFLPIGCRSDLVSLTTLSRCNVSACSSLRVNAMLVLLLFVGLMVAGAGRFFHVAFVLPSGSVVKLSTKMR